MFHVYKSKFLYLGYFMKTNRRMEISLKLESMPTLCRSAFLPADTTTTRRVAETTEVASSVVHRKEYYFRGIKITPDQNNKESK